MIHTYKWSRQSSFINLDGHLRRDSMYLRFVMIESPTVDNVDVNVVDELGFLISFSMTSKISWSSCVLWSDWRSSTGPLRQISISCLQPLRNRTFDWINSFSPFDFWIHLKTYLNVKGESYGWIIPVRLHFQALRDFQHLPLVAPIRFSSTGAIESNQQYCPWCILMQVAGRHSYQATLFVVDLEMLETCLSDGICQ